MFRIGRIRAAHHKASADELLIGFLPILLKFCLEKFKVQSQEQEQGQHELFIIYGWGKDPGATAMKL
jgi:hypothetical protein